MRPLDKGLCPQDAIGNDIVVTHYSEWRGYLINRIGYYCAYCNIPLSHTLNVEHVVPKNPPVGYIAGDLLAWENMLLACGPCNSAKGNTPTDSLTYYLPEEHNTLFPFQIVIHSLNNDAAIVQEANGMNTYQLAKARATIDLMALDNIDRRPNVVDIRWRKRKDAKVAVESAFDMYQDALHSPNYNPQITAIRVADFAKSIGFFGLWFERFENEPHVMRALIDNTIIPGTAQNCFDQNNGYRPIHRNPMNTNDPF